MKKRKKNRRHRVEERSSGKFLRRFKLPDDAKTEGIEWSIEDQVLTVTVPKATEAEGIESRMDSVLLPELKAIDTTG